MPFCERTPNSFMPHGSRQSVDEFGSDAGHAGTLKSEVLDDELWRDARLSVDAALDSPGTSQVETQIHPQPPSRAVRTGGIPKTGGGAAGPGCRSVESRGTISRRVVDLRIRTSEGRPYARHRC